MSFPFGLVSLNHAYLPVFEKTEDGYQILDLLIFSFNLSWNALDCILRNTSIMSTIHISISPKLLPLEQIKTKTWEARERILENQKKQLQVPYKCLFLLLMLLLWWSYTSELQIYLLSSKMLLMFWDYRGLEVLSNCHGIFLLECPELSIYCWRHHKKDLCFLFMLKQCLIFLSILMAFNDFFYYPSLFHWSLQRK